MGEPDRKQRSIMGIIFDILGIYVRTKRLLLKGAGKIEKFLTPNINLNTLVQDQPADFTKLLNGYGVKIPDVKAWISEAAAKGASNATEFVARKLVEPVAKGLADFISFAVIFVVSFVLLRIVAMLINKAVKVSGLNRINKAGGVILGLLYGVTASYIFVFLVYYILPYLAANTPLISSWEPVVNGTVFFKWLYEHFPLKNVMG